MPSSPASQSDSTKRPPTVEVIIEIPRGSFLKWGSTGRLDFVSPLPCPFNYGSVQTLVGLDHDLLDAVVLGPRLRRGTRTTVTVYGAVGLTDRGLYDDKLICAPRPVSGRQKRWVLAFFVVYAKCKWLLNLLRGRSGRCASEGWSDPEKALERARPRSEMSWSGPSIPF